jgi:hypothetical protein
MKKNLDKLLDALDCPQCKDVLGKNVYHCGMCYCYVQALESFEQYMAIRKRVKRYWQRQKAKKKRIK